MRGSLVALGRLLIVAVAVTACASSTSTPTLSMTTLTAGWERHFSLDWTIDADAGGARRVRGYITSQHGEPVESLRLLAQALDGAGAVVGQELAWVPGGVNGFGRTYFEIGRLPSAAQYRVSVWEYTTLQNEGWF